MYYEQNFPEYIAIYSIVLQLLLTTVVNENVI